MDEIRQHFSETIAALFNCKYIKFNHTCIYNCKVIKYVAKFLYNWKKDIIWMSKNIYIEE